MSTHSDLAVQSPSRLQQRQQGRFRRQFWIAILILVVLALGLGLVSVLQGPRLSSVEVNPEATVSRPGQRVLLHANQSIAQLHSDAVQITPAVPFTVEVQGMTVVLRFEQMLDYATEYQIKVEPVASEYSSASTVFQYRFQTPDPEFFTLLRDVKPTISGTVGNDRILRHTFSSASTNEVLFEAPIILEYSVLGNVVAAITQQADGTPLILHNRDTGSETRVVVEADMLWGLRAQPSHHLLGFVATVVGSSVLQPTTHTLYLLDLEDSSGIPIPVTGFNGVPLQAKDWRFVPGTTAVVLQTEDSQLYLIDVIAGGEPLPVGQHGELIGFIPGGTELVVTDADAHRVIDLSTATAAELPIALEGEGQSELSPGRFEPLSADRVVQLLSYIGTGATGNYVGSVLHTVTATESVELFRPAQQDAQIDRMCLSPNQRYLSVEVFPADAVFDGYPSHPGFSPTTTYLVDALTGQNLRSVPGFSSSWCTR